MALVASDVIALGLRALHAAGARWPYPAWRGGNICPALPEHDFGRYCCRRCGMLTREGRVLFHGEGG